MDQILSQEEVDMQIQDVLSIYGFLEYAVLNVGYMICGTIEERSDADVISQFQIQTNVFGLLRLTRALLPSMRARRTGTFLNIGSVVSQIGSIGTVLYNASKAAVRSFSLGLYNEIKQFGLRSTLIEPGYFRTEFDEQEILEREKEIHGRQPGDPDRAARVMWEVVVEGKDQMGMTTS
ncbi:hypothetical protein BDZ91DRAFT_804934 [Kalaharituber pfeilii]|nr:hypothetical protein BDZ91DRAFT_804934 [Kalaharituber pfeilii]